MVCAHNKQPYPNVHIQSIHQPYIFYKNTMLYICTLTLSFQFFSPESRSMTSHYVICHMTAVTYHFIVKEKKKKRKIKRKEILNQEKQIKENKNISVQAHYNTIFSKTEFIDATKNTAALPLQNLITFLDVILKF